MYFYSKHSNTIVALLPENKFFSGMGMFSLSLITIIRLRFVMAHVNVNEMHCF